MKRSVFLLVLLFLPLLCLGGCTPEEPPIGPPGEGTGTLPLLNAVTFSIGKADATLIYTAESAVLIDAGEDEDAAEILRFMQRKGIDKLDAFIITHYDKDHVGGADGILNGIAVDKIYATYDNAEKELSEDMVQYRAVLAQKSMTPTVIREKTSFALGEMKFVIYPPHAESFNKKESNNSSLVVHLTYGETRCLFAGDAQEDRINELLTETGLACDLLKVPYHGNDIQNLPAFLALVTPRYGIVTCSDKNPEEDGKMADLRAADVTTFLTRHGDVTFTSDGKKLTVTQ